MKWSGEILSCSCCPRRHRAGAGGNYDLADDTENGRIRLLHRRWLITGLRTNGNGRSGDSCVPSGRSQSSRLMARGDRLAVTYYPASSVSSAKSQFPPTRRDAACMQSRAVIPSGAAKRRSRGIAIVPIEGPLCPYDRDSSTARLRHSARNDSHVQTGVRFTLYSLKQRRYAHTRRRTPGADSACRG